MIHNIIKFLIIIFLFSTYINALASTCESKLSLDKVLSIVKNNHPVIKMAVLSNKISDSELISSQGPFDLRIKSFAYYNRYNSSSEISQPQYVNMYNAELELLTRYGLLIKSGAILNHGDIKTPISPTGEDGEYFVGINAPLFRGARLNEFSVQESLSEYNIQKVYNNYRLVSLELLLKASNTYWKWISAKNKLEIERKLLSLAEFNLQAISKRAKNGDLAAIDVVEVQQEIQRRKGRLILADRYYQKISYELSWFLWDQASSKTQSVIDCDASDFTMKTINSSIYNSKNGKFLALKNRPEIKDLEISQLIAHLEKDFAQNDLLPKLDVALRVGKQLGKSSIDGAVIKGGVEFELPIQRSDAQGRVSKFNLELDRISLEQRNVIQKIFLQVDDVISAIEMSTKNLHAVSEEVKFAEKMEEGENKKFNLGDSNLFVVNTRERSTAEAKIKLIDTLYEYYLALSYFKAVTGQLI